MNFATLHPPLIADPDPHFLIKLAEDSGAALAPPVTVATCKALEDQLDHGCYVFSGIFVNLAIIGEGATEITSPINSKIISKIISKIRRTRPSTPIYLISSESSSHSQPIHSELLKSLTVREQLFKPFTYMQVLKRVNLAQTPEAQQIQVADGTMDTNKVEIVQNDNEFIPILTSQFLAGAPSHFNLYIKLTDKRFIKILRCGDSLGHDRLEFYKKKSVSQFYIRQTDFEDFLSFCSQKLWEILENPKVSAKEKTSLTLQHGKQVMAFLQSRRIAPQAIRHAQAFVESVLTLTDRLKLEEIAEIKKQLTNSDFRDHASACTLISALLGQRLGLRGEKMSNLLGIASFLHDIGLPQCSPMFLDNDEKGMTEAERKIYQEHPTVGAEMLRKLGRLEPIAIQAVAQHHERRNSKGFPEHLGTGQINLISEIIGMSDEFMQQIALCSKLGNLDPIHEMEQTSFDGFSSPVIDAFRKCFGSN